MAAAHVQSGSSGANTNANPSHTLGAAPTQGDLLVCGVSLGNTSTFAAINGYALVAGVNDHQAYFWKIAGASEPAAQAPCTLGTARDWRCAVDDWTTDGATPTLNVSGVTADETSPQDQAALNPTDDIDTIMVGFATNDVARTYSGQTIGGVAATERVDASQNGNAAITLFDRGPVNTASSTFAAQATASGVPSNGAIALLIFKLRSTRTAAGSQPTATGVLARIAQKMRALAGLQPAATGLLTTQLAALRTLAGAQEAASGTLVALFSALQRTMVGAQEAASGTLVVVWTAVRVLAGSQGAPSGILARGLYTGGRVLEGIQAAATGVLSVLAPTPNVGGTATLTETLQDTATFTEALRDTATLTVVPVGG